MIAAQYEIVLPADYDMSVIYRRIAERGSALDDRAGLGLKAYLVRDVADGAPVNTYAPFYLWNDPAAMARFHWRGEGFGGIVRDFGRPRVRTWIGGTFARGEKTPGTPAHAAKKIVGLAPDSDPASEAARLDATVREIASRPGVHSTAWAIDPSRWEAVIFTLLTGMPPAEDGTIYRVGHLSKPGIASLS